MLDDIGMKFVVDISFIQRLVIGKLITIYPVDAILLLGVKVIIKSPVLLTVVGLNVL